MKCSATCTCGKHYRSPETREKISLTRTGMKLSKAHRESMSRVRMGRKHSPEHIRNMTAAVKRVTQTDKHRAKQSVAWTPEMRDEAARRAASLLNTRFFGTQPEQLMASILEWLHVEFEGQKRIRNRVVDFYLPESNSVLEVDGVHWHPDGPSKDRDRELLEAGVSYVVHVTDEQLKSRGWL